MNNLKSKNFTFFPDGQTLVSIKNQAKKEHKSGKYTTRTSALNSISKSICDQSFNKAVSIFESKSPYTKESKLYIPLFDHENNKYTVVVDENVAEIMSDFKIELPYYVSPGNVTYKSFEKIDNGWIVNLDVKLSNDKAFLEIKTTDEGIVIDLYYNEYLSDEDGYATLSLDSTWAMFSEILEFYPIYSHFNFKKGEITDYEAAIQLNHKTIDETTEIARYGDYRLALCGTLTVLTPEGDFLFGESALNLISDSVCSEVEFYKWLNGDDIESLSDYIIYSNPWFEIIDENNDPIVDNPDSIYENKNNLFNKLF
jgi:hypothetical protein